MARWSPLHVLALAVGFVSVDGAFASAFAQCNLSAVAASKAELARVSALRRVDPAATDASVSAASFAYVQAAEACYDQLYGRPTETVDEDGIVFDDGTAYFNLGGRKWGSVPSYGGTGNDNTGPHAAGGTVTYSFMGSGLDLSGDATTGAGTNVSITSLPGYSACFLSDIAAAFAAWSAVANIQFVQVADTGAAFNAAGATGDIRIGAHTFDGPSGTLAHGYYPPPNGSSAAGDIHFDRQETWGCAAGSGAIDIGIVALHEIGHALGLGHEMRSGRLAVMNPTYNPSVASVLLGDDINGGINIYGSSVGVSDDVLLNFGSGVGLWRLDYGVGWSLVHGSPVEGVAIGDLDGNGIDDMVVDFGGTGVWRLMNNTTWSQVHGLNAAHTVVGDLDGNGKDDVILDLPGHGLWALFNLTTWVPIHSMSPALLAVGNIDGIGGDDLIVDFTGYGIWSYRNNASWVQLHGLDASVIAVGQLNSASGADDLLVGFEGYGLYQLSDAGVWTTLSGSTPRRIAVGDIDADGRDDAVMEFGSGLGVHVLYNGATWTGLHSFPIQSVVLGDLDGNGQDEVILDFGAGVGVWAWVNGGSWMMLHGNTTHSAPVVGDFN